MWDVPLKRPDLNPRGYVLGVASQAASHHGLGRHAEEAACTGHGSLHRKAEGCHEKPESASSGSEVRREIA